MRPMGPGAGQELKSPRTYAGFSSGPKKEARSCHGLHSHSPRAEMKGRPTHPTWDHAGEALLTALWFLRSKGQTKRPRARQMELAL